MNPMGEYPELTAEAIEQIRSVLYGAIEAVNLSV